MSLTRANVEAAIVDRCSASLTLVGKAVTTAGANASLNFPIGKAVQAMGFTVADIGLVADVDLAQIPTSEFNRFFDYVELYTLESILTNYTGVDMKSGVDSQDLDNIRKGLAARIDVLENRVRKPYGRGLGTSMSGKLTGGTVLNDPNTRRAGTPTTNPWSIP